MPRKTLDELFEDGPPRRDPDTVRVEMSVEERQFVLWGLKEEWETSRIAEAIGVNDTAVRQFRVDLVKDPDVLLDLEVVEPIEDQGVTMFRCVVCTVHLNSPDQIDRHVLAHFLAGADLDSAVEERQKSSRVHVPGKTDDRESDGPGEHRSEADDTATSPSTEAQASPQDSHDENGESSVIPLDADRAELLQALRRLAALPDASEVPDQREAEANADEDAAPTPETPATPDEQVDTVDLRSAFERMAEQRGLSEDSVETETERVPSGERIEEVERPPDDASTSGYGDEEDGDAEQHERTSDEDDEKRTSKDNGQRQGRNGRGGFLFGWARSANAERQRRDVVGGMGSVKEATSVTIESGQMKILSTKILEVVDYRVVPLSPQLYAGGVVVDAGTISRHLAAALADMQGAHRWVYAAIPGYQSAMRRFDLPDVREIDPKEVIPREARRVLGVPVENAALRWQRLPGRSRVARWLVAAASDTSYSAISAVVKGTGHKIRALELRPFALTRAVGHPTMICVCVSSDGCDVVVVRQWEPHTYQSVYWETGSVSDSSDLVRRLTEVVENTIDLHNLHNPEVSLTPDVPMAITGGETEHDPNLRTLLASNVGRELVEGKNPLRAPSDFPYDSMVVNVGLALWDV